MRFPDSGGGHRGSHHYGGHSHRNLARSTMMMSTRPRLACALNAPPFFHHSRDLREPASGYSQSQRGLMSDESSDVDSDYDSCDISQWPRTSLKRAAEYARDARFDQGLVWMADGVLDRQLEANVNALECQDLADACDILPVQCHLYTTSEKARNLVPNLARAGVQSVTLQVESFLTAAPKNEQTRKNFIESVADAVQDTRKCGIQSVGISALPGFSLTSLIAALRKHDETHLPDRISVLVANPGIWRYERGLDAKLRRIHRQLEGTSCEISALGGITLESLPYIARSGASEAAILHFNDYAAESCDQLYGAKASRRTGLSFGGCVRKDIMHRWNAATRLENVLERQMADTSAQ